MKEPDVLYLLKTFSGQELKDFDKFLRSPYFSEGKNISSKLLYQYFLLLKKYYPKFIFNEKKDEIFFNELHPGKKFSGEIIRKLNSDLLKLAKKFLSVQKFAEEKFAEERYMLGSLFDRKCEKIFYSSSQRISDNLEVSLKDENYFFTKSVIDSIVLDYNVLHKPMYRVQGIQEADYSIINYILYRLLNVYLSSISTNRLSVIKREMFLFNDVMKYVENNNELFTKYPVILVNLYLIKLHTTLNEKYFSILKRLHKKHFDEFDKSTQHNYYIMMSNFCLSRIWNGFGEYYNEKFELDNDFLKTELYKSFDVYFHPTTFINIGLYALKLKKIRWVKEFINNYGKEVFPEFRDFASSYLQAEIFFTESDNNAALEAIARLQPATPAHKQFIRDLTLKIYYETDNSEPAEYLISSGLHHIRHNENLVDERRKSEGNFLLYLQKLIKLKETNDKFKINLMKNDLAKKMDIVNKDWLMEKVNEL